MDSIRVSEAPDTGSIPVEATKKQLNNLCICIENGIPKILRKDLRNSAKSKKDCSRKGKSQMKVNNKRILIITFPTSKQEH